MLNQRLHIQATEQAVRIAGLPAGLDGFRIVHLTDLHHGRHTPLDLIAKAVEMANGMAPALVALTGDYVTGDARHVWACAEVLERLQAPQGVLAVLGNHDHWVGAATVAQGLAGAGIRILSNSSAVVERNRDRLAIIGVEDLWTAGADLDGALAGVDSDCPRLLLTHNPDLVEEMPDRGIALALAGHTHGGQVGLPWIRGLTVPSRYGARYAQGLVQGPHTRVYVNRGIGTVGVPLRLRCPPEVALIVLRADPGNSENGV